ncbi:protein-glutamate methylesterase/protein-glutamine glutaminase [Marinagarivorans algicola]|uniref:protein-glutamate methylesterase/protein-glutamine glutaminase n=1 Tax=Marinagarivorans algicola TaxID=1513270 RepID=UPI0006B9A30B|nr:chemotaxis response regulator protein-glutamate methylesterase [Marinagarivorans algicola]
MIYNVLVVDDSNFFQNRLTEIINEHPDLNVIGVATNGQEAIDLARELKPDVISMDYEMPLLDGVTAVKMILAEQKVPIIMFSSLTYDGARITLDALDAGAVDFISKNFSEISQNSSHLKQKLHSRLLSFAKKFNLAKQQGEQVDSQNQINHVQSEFEPTLDENSNDNQKNILVHNKKHLPLHVHRPSKSKLLVIGASTGGPVAVHQVLDALPSDFPLPIVVIQHMPPNFTRALAERLNKVCALNVAEAKNGDQLIAGNILVAPGGMQCMFNASGAVKLLEGDDRMNYKPSLDIAFASAANCFGAGVLGIVLTGMGADGCEGAKILKHKGGTLWGQDEASCIVYGMPKAVADAGLCDQVMRPGEMGAALTRVT